MNTTAHPRGIWQSRAGKLQLAYVDRGLKKWQRHQVLYGITTASPTFTHTQLCHVQCSNCESDHKLCITNIKECIVQYYKKIMMDLKTESVFQ